MKLYLSVLCLIISLQSKAQFDTLSIRKNALAGEDSLIALFKKKDWASYANYMYPGLIKMFGNKEKFVSFLEQTMNGLANAEIEIFKNGNVLQLLKVSNGYQSINETFMQMKYNGILISGSSYDVGFSEDGVHWTYFRINERATADQINQIIPELSPELKLPKPQMQSGKTLEEFMAAYQLQYLN